MVDEREKAFWQGRQKLAGFLSHGLEPTRWRIRPSLASEGSFAERCKVG